MTTETVVGGILDHMGAYGIVFDIVPARPYRLSAFEKGMFKPVGPERSPATEGSGPVVPRGEELLDMAHEPTDVPATGLPFPAGGGVGSQGSFPSMKGLVPAAGLFGGGLLAGSMDQQVEVTGHHLVGNDAHGVKQADAVKQAYKLFFLDRAERQVGGGSGNPVVAVVPRWLVIESYSASSHGRFPFPRPRPLHP